MERIKSEIHKALIGLQERRLEDFAYSTTPSSAIVRSSVSCFAQMDIDAATTLDILFIRFFPVRAQPNLGHHLAS